MKRINTLTALLLTFGPLTQTPVMGQTNCRPLLSEASRIFNGGKGDLRKAFKTLQDVEVCDHRNELLQERQVLQIQIFNAIEKQRQDEIEARREAARALGSASTANQRAQTLLDSLQIVLYNLDKANADKVRLILAEVYRHQAEHNFDAAADKLQTARILRALPDSVNLSYHILCRKLLQQVQNDLQEYDFKSAAKKIKIADGLEVLPKSVDSAYLSLQNFLFKNSGEDIIHSAYNAAAEKLQTLSQLNLSTDTLIAYYFELAFCFAETGNLKRSQEIMDTLAQFQQKNEVRINLTGLSKLSTAAQKQTLRGAREKMSMQMERQMQAKYFPTGFKKIQGGTLKLGNEASNATAPKATCTMVVQTFMLAEKEVTFNEFDLYCAATGRQKPLDNTWGRGMRPVVDVTWYDAIKYCNWRSRQEGLEAVYSIINENAQDTLSSKNIKINCNWTARGYRLASAAEWEFAAGNGEFHTQYSWGNAPPAGLVGGNVADESIKPGFPDWTVFEGYTDGHVFTAPAGQYEPNLLGLFDMSGNVWEWCWDRYDPDPCSSPKKQKPDYAGRNERMLRGGSWGSYPDDCEVSRSLYRPPTVHNFSIGFRLAQNHFSAPNH